MDCAKIGRLIYTLRTERKLTQQQLADCLNISDKAVSKWERGLGCPDVSLLSELSEVLEVDLRNLLSGEININDFIGGNMKNFIVVRFAEILLRKCPELQFPAAEKCFMNLRRKKLTNLKNSVLN